MVHMDFALDSNSEFHLKSIKLNYNNAQYTLAHILNSLFIFEFN